MKDAKLVDMKLTREERKYDGPVATPSDELRDPYPWGLQLRLENNELEKLGMKVPQVGGKVTISAVGEIEAVHENQHRGQEKVDRGVTIQIKTLAIT